MPTLKTPPASAAPPTAQSSPSSPVRAAGSGERTELLLRALQRTALAAVVMAALPHAGRTLGTHLKPGIQLVLVLGVLAISLFPRRPFVVAWATGLGVLLQWVALRFLGYHLLLISVAFALRNRPRLLALALGLGVFVIPKEMFRLFYHFDFLHDWINAFMLAHLVLLTAYWYQSKRRGKAHEQSFSAWLALFLFPTHPMNPMNFAPADIWQERTAGVRAVLETSLLVAIKTGVVLVLLRWQGRLTDLPADRLLASSPLAVWSAVAQSYLFCALTLSGTADIAILIARLFGWPLPHPFRWALLAWNPVELWRRWAIYNRRLLLTLVYFPLGGSERHRLLNVMITFLASGFLLHSGWVGSKYWELGAGGWRDQTVYFLFQGLAVCACLIYWQIIGKEPRADRDLRLSPGRLLATAATQAFSALVHVLVLAPHVEWWDRFRLIARCFGW
jgi:hypothetical protein